MNQEIETDGEHATMREIFSLVQNIIFIEHTDTVPAHVGKSHCQVVGSAFVINLVWLSSIHLWRDQSTWFMVSWSLTMTTSSFDIDDTISNNQNMGIDFSIIICFITNCPVQEMNCDSWTVYT